MTPVVIQLVTETYVKVMQQMPVPGPLKLI
jgi:hypothetical protein